MKTQTWLMLGAVGAVIVVGVVLYRKIAKHAKDAADAIADPIADVAIGIGEAYDYVTGNGPAEATGRAVLPNGQRIPISQLTLNPDASFIYGGVRYKMTARRADNDYDAVKVN